ncbi:MAG: UDP-2,3-diacylglucosamine diphosphatase [Bacteroidetes bacterium]|nr:UDP-2,3-diacylglucosamine diphosphatase [Bacteroidota bacterium]MBL6962496.1 UDP-2,3-diacylglucosamine diphosphatase [Bacteroidota bacterium]
MTDKKKNTYFASDFHLGVPDYASSRKREDKIVEWLNSIQNHLKELYLLGDIFDFWFEYKRVIPKGFIRIQGKLAELSDSGVKIYLFKGNHDLWMKDYFIKELNIEIIDEPLFKTIGEKKFYIAHGDGLGPGDIGFKFIKRIFIGKLNMWLFRWIHPDAGIKLANFFSGKSRMKNSIMDDTFLAEDEFLVQHARKVIENNDVDFLLFGHRHFPITYKLNDKSTYVNLGDMITHNTYAVFDGNELELKTFEPNT